MKTKKTNVFKWTFKKWYYWILVILNMAFITPKNYMADPYPLELFVSHILGVVLVMFIPFAIYYKIRKNLIKKYDQQFGINFEEKKHLL